MNYAMRELEIQKMRKRLRDMQKDSAKWEKEIVALKEDIRKFESGQK